jgi:hypothetical protein
MSRPVRIWKSQKARMFLLLGAQHSHIASRLWIRTSLAVSLRCWKLRPGRRARGQNEDEPWRRLRDLGGIGSPTIGVTILTLVFPYRIPSFEHYWQNELSMFLLAYMPYFQQKVLGRTNRLLSLIRHWPHWKRRVLQFFYCLCIRYRGYVSTEPLPSNGLVKIPLSLHGNGSVETLPR